MTLIYKICPAALWRDAEAAGRFDGAAVDLADGFIHFSTAAQAPRRPPSTSRDRTIFS